MYIDLSSKVSADSVEISAGVVIDYDENGNVVGIDIDNASTKIDMKELILSSLPEEQKVVSA